MIVRVRAFAWIAAVGSISLAACGDSDKSTENGCDPDDAQSCAQGTLCKAREDDATGFECVPGCRPDDATSCADGLVCEQLGTGDHHECLSPLLVTGRVVSSLDGAGLPGASIVGLDANGAARTRVARSGADGHYELPISIQRNEDGSPIEEAITLRAAAADHQPFPLAPRTALPIRLASATRDDKAVYRVENTATSVALLPLPEAQRGGSTVAGSIDASRAGGVLVLAVADGRAQSTAVSDRDGSFVLFNVKAGPIVLEGYRAGLALESESVNVPAAGLTDVRLRASTAKLATVSGSMNLVNADGGQTTSVILALASTFDAMTARGEAPAGLRASDVSGSFSISNVPPGRYAVLAAFENDQLVRDPDRSIAGTDIVFVDVGSSGSPVSLSQSFKVTGALAVISPGAQTVDEMPASTINLTWADDSSEDGYELRVYDALGTLVHENKMIPSVTGGRDVQYALNATSFTRGMLYQFRVWSWRSKGGQMTRTYISASEDLRGVFQIAR